MLRKNPSADSKPPPHYFSAKSVQPFSGYKYSNTTFFYIYMYFLFLAVLQKNMTSHVRVTINITTVILIFTCEINRRVILILVPFINTSHMGYTICTHMWCHQTTYSLIIWEFVTATGRKGNYLGSP